MFADEGGAFPESDVALPLIGAAFATTPSDLDGVRLPLGRSRSPRQIVELLQAVGAHPASVGIIPYPGFSRNVERYVDRMSVMGLRNLRETGVNAGYMGADGLRVVNTVWTYAVTASVLHAVQRWVALEEHYPDSVRVFFDARSLSAEQRKVAELTTRKIGSTLQSEFVRSAVKYPHLTEFRALAGHLLPRDRIAIEWEDEPGFSGPPGAMYLVDSLASGIFQAFKRADGRALFVELARAGYQDCFIDGTEMIDRGPDPALVARWERESGLVVPRW